MRYFSLLDSGPSSVIEGISFVGNSRPHWLRIPRHIYLFSFARYKAKWAPMPAHTDWHMMTSTAMLGGISFHGVDIHCHPLVRRCHPRAGRPAQPCQSSGIVVGSLLSGLLAHSSGCISHFPKERHPILRKSDIDRNKDSSDMSEVLCLQRHASMIFT